MRAHNDGLKTSNTMELSQKQIPTDAKRTENHFHPNLVNQRLILKNLSQKDIKGNTENPSNVKIVKL